MPTYQVKLDAGHLEVTKALRRIHWPFVDVAKHRGLGCDILTRHKDGYPIMLELKRPGPPSARKLTDSEAALQGLFPSFYRIAQTLDEALGHIGLASGQTFSQRAPGRSQGPSKG